MLPHQKGSALAVAAIEKHILQTSPGLNEKTFRIESNKIVIVDGVRHEIDLFVTVDPAPGYASVHVFEFKNWQDAVGKDEIYQFSGKIDAVRAQHGYFVAKSFTKYARDQAELDRRITLLVASEHDPCSTPAPIDLHQICSRPRHSDTVFHVFGSTGKETKSINLQNAEAKLLGEKIDLTQYLNKLAEATCQQSNLTFNTTRLPEERYPRDAESVIKFSRGEMIVNGIDMERVVLSVSFDVYVARPVIESHFHVESRGRVVTYAPAQFRARRF
jgi:hypothetical protein